MLGRVLRISVDPMDQKLVAMFRNAHKESKSVVDGSINQLRNQLNLVQAMGHDLIMALLKTGGPG